MVHYPKGIRSYLTLSEAVISKSGLKPPKHQSASCSSKTLLKFSVRAANKHTVSAWCDLFMLNMKVMRFLEALIIYFV